MRVSKEVHPPDPRAPYVDINLFHPLIRGLCHHDEYVQLRVEEDSTARELTVNVECNKLK